MESPKSMPNDEHRKKWFVRRSPSRQTTCNTIRSLAALTADGEQVKLRCDFHL